MKEISVQELKQKIDNKEDFQLIDVREEHEFEAANLNGDFMPMGSVLEQTENISHDKPVIIHCKSGRRSAAVIQELEKRFGYTNLYNLRGGIMAYAQEIDPTLDVI